MKKIFYRIIILIIIIAFPFIVKSQTVGLEIGNIAPELKWKNHNGKTISLSSLKGHVVLIDFWASWCKPCRSENPIIVAAYKKYKNTKFLNFGNGFTVLSISLDKTKEVWIKAIKDDGLEWENHLCDFNVWNSDLARLYSIKSIPMNFLIDKDGIIISKNLRGVSIIENKLSSMEYGKRNVPGLSKKMENTSTNSSTTKNTNSATNNIVNAPAGFTALNAEKYSRDFGKKFKNFNSWKGQFTNYALAIQKWDCVIVREITYYRVFVNISWNEGDGASKLIYNYSGTITFEQNGCSPCFWVSEKNEPCSSDNLGCRLFELKGEQKEGIRKIFFPDAIWGNCMEDCLVK